MLGLSIVRPRLLLLTSTPSVPREHFSIMVLSQSSVVDLFSAVAAGGMVTAFTGAQPVASASAAPTTLAVPVQGASEGLKVDLRFLLEDGNVGAAFMDSLEVNGFISMQEFAGLEHNRTHMRDVIIGAFGLPCSEFLIYVEALNSAECLVVVEKRITGRMLLEAIVEQMREGELYPDQFSDVENVRDEYELLANTSQMLYLQNPSPVMLRNFTLVIFTVALGFLVGERVFGKTVKVSLGSVAPPS